MPENNLPENNSTPSWEALPYDEMLHAGVAVEVPVVAFTHLSIAETRYWYDMVPRCSWLCPSHDDVTYLSEVTEAMTELAEFSAN